MASTDTKEPRSLQGLRVADFAGGIAGPHVGLLLAHHGADVIKIEPPEGDWSRVLGCNIDEFSPFAVYYNRGKRSVAIDLKSAQGREAALEIALKSDVVLESFRPGVMKRLGLDYETLKGRKPDIVYLSISGFGQDGPNSQLPATDTVIQGYSGLMSLNSSAEGAPQRFPAIIVDVVSGLYGFQALMAAIVSRFRWGRGAYIDCSLMQSGLALQAPSLVKHRFERGQPTVMYVPLGVLRTKDSYLSISVNRDAHFEGFCRAMGRPELAEDSDYSTLTSRIANEKSLMTIIRSEFLLRSTDDWVVRLQDEGILHARVRTYEDVLADPELLRSGALDWLQHSSIDEALPIPNIPGGPKASEYGDLCECPRVGQHSREVLNELGFLPERIERLVESGAIVTERRVQISSKNGT